MTHSELMEYGAFSSFLFMVMVKVNKDTLVYVVETCTSGLHFLLSVFH